MKKHITIKAGVTVLTMWAGLLTAQEFEMPKPDNYYRRNPAWITMMEDSNANYFVAVRAFELYWENHQRPMEKDELLKEEYKEEREQKHFARNLFRKQQPGARELAEAYKRFEFWRMNAQPYVQPDGTILTKDEQLRIWQQERNRK